MAPMPTMQFKGKEAHEFLKQHKGGEELLDKYLADPSNNTSASKIEVSSLKYPYKEFSWLFAHIIGMESMTFVPRNIIYVLHFTLHENAIIDWGHIISSEISFQLSNLKKTHEILYDILFDFHHSLLSCFQGLSEGKECQL
jgi:hypothetical protein